MDALQELVEQLIFLQAANIGAADPPVNNHDRVAWARSLVTRMQRERRFADQPPLGPNGFPKSVNDEWLAAREVTKQQKLQAARDLIQAHEQELARKAAQ